MGKRILLVEDDQFLIDIYQKKLKSSGFEVEVADTGHKAISKAKDFKPDLIVLDVVLPGMEGWEVLKQLKANPETKNIKAIFMSNLSQREEIEKGLKAGALKYLIKSQYTPSEVVSEIKKLC